MKLLKKCVLILHLLQGELAAKKELDIYDERNNFGVVTQLADFMSDAANWDSFIWGGFGGMTMYGGRSLVNKAVYGKRNNEYAAKQYQLLMNALSRYCCYNRRI